MFDSADEGTQNLGAPQSDANTRHVRDVGVDTMQRDSGGSAVRIVEVEVVPLTGATVDGGWPQGHEPQENLHTLVQIRTDSGIYGWGGCFTSGTLSPKKSTVLPLASCERVRCLLP